MKYIISIKSFTVYLITIISIYIISRNCTFLGETESWINFSLFLAGMTAPATAIGMIYITYHVYKRNSNEEKVELYFSKIVDLILHIEENYALLKVDIAKTNELKMKIKQYVVLARYYLKRFPDKHCKIDGLDLVLNNINFVPDNDEYYKSLDEEFNKFCFYTNQDKQRPISCEKDKNGRITFIQE